MTPQTISVLYVDDESELLDLGKVFLESMGEFRVDTITSASDALAVLQKQPYDAIISDYHMPVMDGIAFLKAVRASGNEIPFILFTGRGREEVVIEAINNGADFYIQKGGDPRAQFAELAHKVRQAVGRKRAEHSLIESEKRLTDIINFLPDATFAIDKDGTVIAWNRAIEEMTGVPAAEMLGKGTFEYAIPFYGSPRKILIDMIACPDDVIAKDYVNIHREKDVLIAETDLPRPKGRRISVFLKASPLYNRQGEIAGAIESIRDITERKKAEDDLRSAYEIIAASEEELRSNLDEVVRAQQEREKSEEKYRSFVETSPDIIWDIDAQGRFLYISPRIQEILGYPPEKIIGKTVIDLMPDEEKPQGIQRMKHLLSPGGSLSPFEVPARHRDGHTIILEIRPSETGTDGKREGFRGVAVDITERKQNEEALHDSEERYRLLIDHAPAALAMFNREMRYLAASRRWITDFHLEGKEIIGRSHFEIFPDLPDYIVKDAIPRAMAGEVVSAKDDPFSRADGTVEWLNWEILPWHTADHAIGGVIIFTENITARKKSEDELRAAYEQLTASEEELRNNLEEVVQAQQEREKSEKNFQALADNAPDAIYIQTNNRFRYLNNAALRLFGASFAGDLLGTSIIDRIHPSFHERIRERIRNLTVDFQPVGRLEEIYLKLDGTPVDVEVSAVPFLYEREHGVLVIARDITERKQREAELRAAYEQLAASDEELRGQYEELAFAQQKLQESEGRSRRIMEQAPLPFALVRNDGTIAFVNERLTQVFGYTAAEVPTIRDWWLKAYPDPDYRLQVREQWEEAIGRSREEHAEILPAEYRVTCKNGEERIIEISGISLSDGLLVTFIDRTELKRAEEALRKRLIALTAPLADTRVAFEDLFDPDEIQKLQDEFAKAMGVSMLLTRPDGTPITRPSNFCRLCGEIVRRTPAGIARCYKSDAMLGGLHKGDGPKIHRCLSAGLWGAGANIVAGDRHIASWIIGQVRNESQTEGDMRKYAREIGVNEDEFILAFREVPVMSSERFASVAQALSHMANQLSRSAYQNVQQARFITERERAEDALFTSRQMLQAVLDSIPQRVFWKDRNSVFLGCNKPNALDAGLSDPAEIVGITDYDYTTAEIAELYRADDRKVMESGQPKLNYEEPQIRSDGSRAWLRTSKVPLRNQEGEIIGVLGTYEDITEYKNAQEKLRESEEKYRQLYDSMIDAFACVDLHGRITLFNESFRQMVGYEPAEITALTYNDLTPEKWHAKEAEIIEHQVLRRGYSEIYEKEYRRKDGTVFPAEVRTFLMKDTAGNIKGMWAIVRDITERKKAEEAIRNEQQFSDTIIDSIPGVFYVFDEQGRFIRSNRNHLTVLGYTENELHQITALDTIAPEDRAIAAENIRGVFSQGYTTITAKILTKDGRKIPYLLSGVSLTVAGRKYLVGTGIDITEQVQAQETLRESEEKYRVLFTQMTEGCALHEMIYDGSGNPADYRILDVNPAFEFILKMKREAVVGKTGRGAYGVELPPFLETYARVVSTGRAESFEVYFAPMEKHFFISVYSPGPGRFATIFSDITERKRAEEALKSREELLRLFIAHAPAALAMLDKDLRYIAASNRWRADYHLGDRDLIGHSHLEIFPELSEEIIAVLHRGLGGEVSSSNEDKFVRQDGAVQWLAWEVRPWYTSGRNVGGVIIFSEDITGRKVAEEALRESEEKYRAIVEDNQDMVYRTDMNGIFTMVNPAGARLVGLKSPSELIGRPVAEHYLNPDDRMAFIEALKKNGSVENYPVTLRSADGRILQVLVNSHFFHDANGVTLGVEGIIHDVTELKRVEDLLRENQLQLAAAMDLALIVNWEFDVATRIFTFNDRFYALYGTTADREGGYRMQADVYAREFVHPDDVNMLAEEFQKVIETTDPLFMSQAEHRIIRRDGEIRHIIVRHAVTLDASGRTIRTHGVNQDVTERKRAEDALRESEEKFRALVETTSDFIWEVDTQGVYTYISPQVRDILGYDPDEVVGKTPFDLMPPEEVGRVSAGFAGYVNQQTPFAELVNTNLHKNGSRVVLETSGVPWFARDGTFAGYRGVDRDITDRKRVEDALRESEEKYRAIVENNQDMVYRADMNGIITMVNPAAARLARHTSPEEMVGRPITDYYMNPDDRAVFIKALKKTGSVENYPFVLKAVDGTVRHVMASSHFYYDPEGKIKGVEGIIHDVTELRLTEQALHTAQEKFSKAFQEAPDAITLSDLDSGEFLEVNDAATKIFGYSRDELIGHTASELGIWPDREKREVFFSQLRKNGRVEHYEVVERRKSGELYYCHVNADTILIGNRKCLLAVIRDVTEQKNAQDALKKAHDELEERVQERTKSLRESEERLRLKLDSVLSPDTDISKLELANILDIPEIQALMEDFSRLTGMATAVLDMKGNIIENTGGRDICMKFHRKHERTAKFCTESDLFLAGNLNPGQHVLYKCKNGLWDVAAPIYFGTKHAGNIYTGQFFFTDEPVDEHAFLARAEEYGFDKNEYMAALSRVPRFSREQVDILMDYLVRFTRLISRISFSNLELAQAKNRLELTAEDLRNLSSDLDRRVIERTAELSQAQEAYQKANEKLNLLSSITRHDIKNQLLLLTGFLEISKKSLADPAKTAEFIAKERRIADTIAHQIDFTKDYEDLGVKTPVWQNVDAVIHRAVAPLPLGKIRVITGNAALEIFADPLLEKVFYNLTDNALRYGGEKMTCIRASRHINNGNLLLIFEDDGEGIRNEDKARLFTRGFGKNTGLGLYLSREILSITDITITETGEPGKGARFEISVPAGAWRDTGKKE